MKKIIYISLLVLIIGIAGISTANGISDKTVIKMQIGNKNASINGVSTLLDVSPSITNGRTLVPIRFVSEELGAFVQWESTTKTITITVDSVEYLKNEIKTLESKNTSLNSELNASKTKISQLESSVKALTDQNAELKKKIAELEAKLGSTTPEEQLVEMHITYTGFEPNTLRIKKGIPVKWVIYGDQVSSCTNKIIVPALNISKSIVSGTNIVNFTPQTSGTIDFSCWMGMVRGKFIVE